MTLAGPQLGLAATQVEDHLAAIADLLDRGAVLEGEVKPEDEYEEDLLREARAMVNTEDLLQRLSDALEQCLGFVGDETNRKLAVLVAMSRLLPVPTGSILRGPAGSGKSTLLKAVARLVPPGDVMVFSRVTPQSLYFLPEERLQHRLLVVDEYEGMADSEYALRTLMSSQLLSLAITVREGGRLPVTRTVNRPARLAVMASTTGTLNPENLSRFLELTLDASAQQSERVLRRMGEAGTAGRSLRVLHAAQSLLVPLSVSVPFAARIMPAGGDVRVRRRFGHILALIKAHAILHQHRRSSEDGTLLAQIGDYEAVRPLLSHWIDHPEEDLSPPAMRLLEHLHRKTIRSFVRREVMAWMGWSYSTAYRTLKELERLELIQGDHRRNGVKRTYSVSAYDLPDRGMDDLPRRLMDA